MNDFLTSQSSGGGHTYFVQSSIVHMIGEILVDEKDVGWNEECDLDESLRFVKSGDENSDYVVRIPQMFQYQVSMDLVQHGATFRQTECIMEAFNKRLKDKRFAYVNRQKISNFSRICCDHSYQILSDLLENMWEFSISIDSGNKSGVYFLTLEFDVSMEILYLTYI